MSKENLEQFMKQIAESEELQAKIGEEIDAEALIALGAECGCEFTAEELFDSTSIHFTPISFKFYCKLCLELTKYKLYTRIFYVFF